MRVLFLALLLSACASQGVHCKGRLKPINPPVTGSLGDGVGRSDDRGVP